MRKLFWVGLFFICTAAQAATVQLDGTNATGILGLELDGTLYDVTFEFSSGPHTEPAPGDIFADPISDEAGASAAADAINLALNASSATTVGSSNSVSYIVPYLYNSAPCDTLCAFRGPFVGVWLKTAADVDTNASVEFARFTPAAVVPLPAAGWLFGSGLMGLAVLRRKIAKARA
jgi:hypothetical protein